jgi:hypothetical protein
MRAPQRSRGMVRRGVVHRSPGRRRSTVWRLGAHLHVATGPYPTPVVDVILRCSAHDFLAYFSTDLTSTSDPIKAMLTFRTPGWKQPDRKSVFTPHLAPIEHPPLIDVARDRGLLKVDTQGAYR